MLGREPVVDGEHRVTALGRKGAARRVVRLEIPDDPAAAVEVHEQAETVVAARPVEPRGHTAGVDVADLVELDRGRLNVRAADRPSLSAARPP